MTLQLHHQIFQISFQSCSPELVRSCKHHTVSYLLLVWFGIELGVLLHVSRPLFDTKLSDFQNSADSPRGR